MNILVSACLTGENCKYNGGNNLNEKVVKYIKGHNVIKICPEMLSGLGCPRPCAEILNGIVINKNGESMDAQFHKGVELALQEIEGEKIDLAILQSRSPSCGAKSIYDGTFSGKLIEGQGLFAKALAEKGIKVIDCEDI